MTEQFNFREEIEAKYDMEVYDLIMESFDCLPIAALVDNKILAVHGGISPDLKDLSVFDHINRF